MQNDCSDRENSQCLAEPIGRVLELLQTIRQLEKRNQTPLRQA